MLIDIKIEDYFNESNQDPAGGGDEKVDSNLDGNIGTAPAEMSATTAVQDTDIQLLFRSLIMTEFEEFQDNFREWMNRSPSDENFSTTSLPEALGELFHVQKDYLQLIEVFASLHRNHISAEQLAVWNQEVTSAFKELILQFTVQHSTATQLKIHAQQESIAEMNAPLIFLAQQTGLLPLAGNITAHESQFIYEKTLKKCSEAKLEKLFIDLSGVRMIDRKGAQQLSLLFDGLKILGVKTELAGISPGIAKIFVQLNFDFSTVEISNTLVQALKTKSLSSPR